METTGKKRMLIFTIIFLIFNAWFLLLSPWVASGGEVGLLLFVPLLIFFLIYFIVLALRYAREKGAMQQLDKIEFFILLAYFILLLGLPTLHNLGIAF